MTLIRGRCESGYICIWNEAETGNERQVECPSPTLYTIGGATMFVREKFLTLGGFDGLYFPATWEDIDISYRALKRGWKILYEPSCVVYHKHHATMSNRYKRDSYRVIEQKNEILFTWRNIADPDLIREHFLNLPKKIFHTLFSGDFTFARAVFSALKQSKEVIIKRNKERKHVKKTDQMIFDKPLCYYRNFMRRGFRCAGAREKRRVLIMTPFLPYPLFSGGNVRIYTLIKMLSQKYDIILLSFINGLEQEKDVEALNKICKSVHTVLVKPYIPKNIQYCLYPREIQTFYSLEMVNKLRGILKTEPIDLVQIEGIQIANYIDNIHYVPTILVEHDISFISFLKTYDFKGGFFKRTLNLMNWLRKIRFETNICSRFSKIITVTEEDRKTLRPLVPHIPIETVTTGVDLDYFKPSYKGNSEKNLVYVGHFRHYPNEDAVLYFCKKIFPFISRSSPNTKLYVVGSNPTRRIKELQKKFQNVVVTGYVEDVRSFLSKASVFVLPARLGLGIKGKMLEAMAMGVPVVTTSVGCRGIRAVPGKDVIMADEPKEFAKKTLELLENPELQEEIGNNGRSVVEKYYDWKVIAEKVDGIYQNLIY